MVIGKSRSLLRYHLVTFINCQPMQGPVNVTLNERRFTDNKLQLLVTFKLMCFQVECRDLINFQKNK